MKDDSSRSDEEIMREYVQGSELAFEELFRRYAPILLRLTRRHTQSEEDAREIVQQTFFQLHAARADFRLECKLRPWVFTIAMNLVREYYRKLARRRETPMQVEPTSAPDTNLEDQERSRRIRECLQYLPSSQREVVELHWFQGRPFSEVAEVVGSTEGAVRVRAHRAYSRLRELWNEKFRGA